MMAPDISSRRLSPEVFDDFAAQARPQLRSALERETQALALGFPVIDNALASSLGIGATPGRRWRPLLAMATAEALGISSDDRILDLALAVEFTHTASLILDDLPCMDDDDRRRGEPATHRRAGTAAALLMAIGLLARSAELLGGTGQEGAELARSWGATFGLKGMSGGQAIDLALGARARGEKRRLYRKKSTALVEFAVGGSATLARSSSDPRVPLARFGRDLGWAYQLADDRIDQDEDAANGRGSVRDRSKRMGPRLLRRALAHLENSNAIPPHGVELLSSAAVAVAAIPTEVTQC
jgi:geranylgeranyl pyrophosphate synthase